MNFRSTAIFLILFIMISVLMSCQSQTNKSEEFSEAVNNELNKSIIDTSAIIISEGGGFTGLVEGFTLKSYGKVEHWQKFPSKEKVILWNKKISKAEFVNFINKLKNTDLLNYKINNPGNYSYTVEYLSPDSNYTWMWKEKEASKELLILYDSLKKFCNKLNE